MTRNVLLMARGSEEWAPFGALPNKIGPRNVATLSGAGTEVEPCLGILTRTLILAHGAQRVTCIELHPHFAKRLCRLGGGVRETSAHTVARSFDTFVRSCCLYDIRVWFLRLIDASLHHVMTTHRASDERNLVVPAIKALGWCISDRQDLARATEALLDEPIERQSALMYLWTGA